jgi:hypothetical protein
MRRFSNYDLTGQPPVLAWNPIVMRCPGCGLDADPTFHPGRADKHCWHLRACDMGANNPKLPMWMRDIKAGRRPANVRGIELSAPANRCEPAVIATGFMGDPAWWGEGECAAVLAVIRWSQRHTFLLLTKWPERLEGVQFPDNAWIGVSVTNQADADRRIPALLRLLCRHRWVSVEPMLGPVDVTQCRHRASGPGSCAPASPPTGTIYNALTGAEMGYDWHGSTAGHGPCAKRVEFVACGPETGPRARPCDPTWIVNLRDQCSDAGVPFYDKRDPGAGRFGNCGRDWPQEWKAANGTKGMTP